MVLWLIFAAMTAAAVFAVVWPLGRKPSLGGGSDRLVYQDQLAEIDRDRAAGLIGQAEAESARIEISRRLLAAADAEAPAAATPASSALWRRRVAALAAIVVVPAVALGFYLRLGSPDVPDQSAFARVNSVPGHQSIEGLVSQVEAHLASNPNDGAGWEVLAPVYLRMGRPDDAVAAWRKAIVLNGDSPARESALGEALVAPPTASSLTRLSRPSKGRRRRTPRRESRLLSWAGGRAGRQQCRRRREMARFVGASATRRTVGGLRARGAWRASPLVQPPIPVPG